MAKKEKVISEGYTKFERLQQEVKEMERAYSVFKMDQEGQKLAGQDEIERLREKGIYSTNSSL